MYGQETYQKPAGKTPLLLHAAYLEVPREGKPPIVAQAPMPARFIAAGFTQNMVPEIAPAADTANDAVIAESPAAVISTPEIQIHG
jgi:hypothetical protein